jgi:hypothetical protein
MVDPTVGDLEPNASRTVPKESVAVDEDYLSGVVRDDVRGHGGSHS